MTDNEIIKALECCKKAKINQDCVVLKCPFSTEYGCNIGLENLRNEALDLINRQKAEIERLQDYNENLQTANTALSNEILDIKFEAIKEFAEKLKKGIQANHYYTSTDNIGNRKRYAHLTDIKDFSQYIDNLVKEMTEVSE